MIFSLQFAEPCQKDWFLPPEDPLGELSHLEMGLRRFCYENNCKIILKIGYEDQKLFLDPDIILILDELPEKISQLLKNQKIELSFPESWMVIYFEPLDHRQINCIWKKYGKSSKKNNFKLKKNEVLQVLEYFVCEIGSKAVDGGYITDKEKCEFLRPISKQPKY